MTTVPIHTLRAVAQLVSTLPHDGRPCLDLGISPGSFGVLEALGASVSERVYQPTIGAERPYVLCFAVLRLGGLEWRAQRERVATEEDAARLGDVTAGESVEILPGAPLPRYEDTIDPPDEDATAPRVELAIAMAADMREPGVGQAESLPLYAPRRPSAMSTPQELTRDPLALQAAHERAVRW